MGLLDFLFGGDGDEPTASQLQKAIKQITQPHGDPAVRMGAADRLRAWGTAEAAAALLRRFTIQTPSGQQDLEECQEVERLLAETGEAAVEPILAFVKREAAVSYPLRVLESILTPEDFVTRVLGVVDELDPVFGSSDEQRAGLLRALEHIDDPRIAESARRFLEDPADDVALAALQCVARADDPESHRADVVGLLVATRDRPRVREVVAEKLAELGWPTQDLRKTVEANLPGGFSLDKKGRVVTLGRR